MNIYHDNITDITYDAEKNILHYISLKSDIDVSDEIFQTSMWVFMDLCAKHEPDFLMIDMNDSTYEPDPESFPAIDKMLTELYNSILLKKRAFIWGDGDLSYSTPSEIEHNFESQRFTNTDDALTRFSA